MCGVESGFGDWCSQIAFVSDRPVFGAVGPLPQPGIDFGGQVKPGVLPDVVQPFGVVRDSFWPKTALSWIVLSIVLIVASVQLVTPARRWRLRSLPLRRRARGSA
jgi:hypothetical protein